MITIEEIAFMETAMIAVAAILFAASTTLVNRIIAVGILIFSQLYLYHAINTLIAIS